MTPDARPTPPTKRECSATVHGERVTDWQCLKSGVIERDGKWYCRQHDPVAKSAKREAKDREWADKRSTERAVCAEGERIAKALGVAADVFYHSTGAYSNYGFRRRLVIDFDDCLKLIDKLKGQP